MSIRGTKSYEPSGELAAQPSPAGRSRSLPRELFAIAGLVVLAGLIEFFLRGMLTRPFYSDESWRAYDISLGTGFLAHLSTSGAPLAFGWVAIEDTARVLLGNTEAALRVPMFLCLPALGVATYLLARRWLGIIVSFCTAALLVLNTWTINNALQLKSYSYEGLFAVAAIAVYLLIQRDTWSRPKLLLLYTTLGLTCVFSLPNLFIVGPLLVLDLIRAIRAGERTWLRIGGEAIAGGIALVHYALFIRPQSGVAGTRFWLKSYAPHQLSAWLHFTVSGFQSFFPGMITGVVGVTNAVPHYRLPHPDHYLLGIVLAILVCAGLIAAALDKAGRALVVAVGASVLLELAGSTLHIWPFGMVRVNIFMLPLLYILVAIGVVRIAEVILGRRAAARHGAPPAAAPTSWWRPLALAAAAVVFAAAGLAGSVATGHALNQTGKWQSKPLDFSELKRAVAHARTLAAPDDLAITRADYYSPPIWYGEEWLYFMHYYRGYPAKTARLPAVPASNTLSVFYVTPATVRKFLAAHPGSPAILLFEFVQPGGQPSATLHQQSLQTLQQFGYCPTDTTNYKVTGQLTKLVKGACVKPG